MTLTLPLITALYAGILALYLVPMIALVIKRRFQSGVGLGSGRDDGLVPEQNLLRAVRIHADFLEFVPTILFLMLLMEITGTSTHILHGIGIALATARALHGWGLFKSSGTTWQRFIGTIMSLILVIFAAIMCILSYFGMTL